jgi:osmotically-inducible protein OsmY
VEQEVQRELLAQPSLRFASLVVRRIDNGVCLQGVLESDDELPDVCHIARRVSGVRQVLNRLVIAPRREVPVKG